MIGHLTEEQIVDLKIGLAFLFLLAVLRVMLWAWDTRFDFERPKKHGEMYPERKRERNNATNRYR